MGVYFVKSFVYSFLVCLLGYVSCQDYFEQRHTQHLRMQEPLLNKIPKKFFVSGPHPEVRFNNYISEIGRLADRDNVTVDYSVKVDVNQISNKKRKAANIKISKSKKYNVPLKKKNMRLSNFEKLMRKFSENSGQQQQTYQEKTTENFNQKKFTPTTRAPLMKYRPIIKKIKTRYAKSHSKPVKNQEVILPYV
ncbi:hypothetical protein NE865_03383 [Phthorimaea operculella]|nr:hypothetical protein NE865_03383 [Phthorimaea operculella]